MTINSRTGELTHGHLVLRAGIELLELQSTHRERFKTPIVTNGQWQTYQTREDDFSFILIFKNGRLWQLKFPQNLAEDFDINQTLANERKRHGLHELLLHRLFGSALPFTTPRAFSV